MDVDDNSSPGSMAATSLHDDDDAEFYYLTRDARRQLPTYQYRGADLSLLYHYVLSPFAGLLVNRVVPKSMAPNTITSIGLVFMLTAYVAYWWYVPSLETEELPPPRWIFLWNGISMLVYQTLDNMDGKQARRTQSASPLGLLFDHGCDAINSIFGSANWIIGMALVPRENPLQTWILVFGPFALFYIATWEQYFTGQLIMPIVNGPNEGLLGGSLLSFTSWWCGSQFWQQTSWFDVIQSIPLPPFSLLRDTIVPLRNCDIVVLAASIAFLQEVIVKSINVTMQYKGPAARALTPFFLLAFCYLLIGWIDPNVWLSNPRTSLHLAMLLFVEMSTDIMLAHVTAQPFNPYRWQMAPLLLLTMWVVLVGNNIEPYQYWILVYTWTMFAYLTMKCSLVIHEVCVVLEIWCFDIITPHRKRKSRSSSCSYPGKATKMPLKED
jgi:ethanolaminephosphotransferase